MPMSDSKIQFPLRIKKTAKSNLEKIAQNDGRSLNNLIEYILDKYLEERESQSK